MKGHRGRFDSNICYCKNVENISVEKRDEGPKITTFMHGGDRKGVEKGVQMEQWVRKLEGPMPTFDPQQEENTYQRKRKEILGSD